MIDREIKVLKSDGVDDAAAVFVALKRVRNAFNGERVSFAFTTEQVYLSMVQIHQKEAVPVQKKHGKMMGRMKKYQDRERMSKKTKYDHPYKILK